MPVLSTTYYDNQKLDVTLKALADAANTAAATGSTGPTGPSGAGPAGTTGATGPTGSTGSAAYFIPPTSDPHQVGAVYNQGGVLMISSG